MTLLAAQGHSVFGFFIHFTGKVASMKKSAEIPKQKPQAKTLASTRRGLGKNRDYGELNNPDGMGCLNAVASK